MAKIRSFSDNTTQAIDLLGAQIKLGRKQRKWSEEELAERAGISRATLQKIEKGATSPAVGLVFELATLVGIKLFDAGNYSLSQQQELTEHKIALLPKRITTKERAVDDDF